MAGHSNSRRLAFSVTFLVLAYVATAQLPEFGYSGAIGPKHWGKLCPAYNMCSTGTSQSPVNIVKSKVELDYSLEELKRDYVDANATLINNGFNIQLRYEQAVGNVSINGKDYSLLQNHWHSPSEHTINGIRFPAELHLVHKSQEGDVAVIAVLYKYGHPDPFLNQMKDTFEKLEMASRGGGKGKQVPAGIIRTKILARKTRTYYRYVGSFTTPPCTENVIWNILGKVRQMTEEQAVALKKPLYDYNIENARPLQKLNGRTIKLYKPRYHFL